MPCPASSTEKAAPCDANPAEGGTRPPGPWYLYQEQGGASYSEGVESAARIHYNGSIYVVAIFSGIRAGPGRKKCSDEGPGAQPG